MPCTIQPGSIATWRIAAPTQVETRTCLASLTRKLSSALADITLPGRNSQAMAIEHSGKRLFINLAATNEVGVVDLQTHQVIAKWSVPEASAQDALALDEANHRVFIACRKPPRFIALDTDTGKVLANLPCVGGL